MAKDHVLVSDLGSIVEALNTTITENKAYLSEIDGAIGDGDHGINMAKGFNLAAEALSGQEGDMASNLKKLSNTLMMKIGGSMGPLYGMFFKAMAESVSDKEQIGLSDFTEMIVSARDAISKISPAKPGDKTLMDCLVPAVESLQSSVDNSHDFDTALNQMKQAAEAGKDSTKDLVSKLGRSSRLGERSRGVLDAGACSCCLILGTLADEVQAKLN